MTNTNTMPETNKMLTFGPVPSRRLGRSLGINNIPPKVCSYSCSYCQLGRTTEMSVKRREFFKPRELVEAVRTKLQKLQDADEQIDYLSFVPDGEPTLDIKLGREIRELQEFGINVAVITNSSLLWHDDVQKDLQEADWVSLKIDAVSSGTWKRVDRPHGFLRLKWILNAIKEFSKSFSGKLVTETMVVEGVNDNEKELTLIADFIAGLNIETSYVSTPIRPPAEKWVKPVGAGVMAMAYELFGERGLEMEQITGFEGTHFVSTGNVKEDLLAITAVHPMREDAMQEFLRQEEGGWDTVEELVREGKMAESFYRGKKFFIRVFREKGR